MRLVVDTGAGPTIIAPELLDELGYSARQHGEQVASTRSIAGREQGYMLRVKQLECLGMVEHEFRVYAQDLPTGWDIDGLLGLSFLRHLNYEVRSIEGRILAERAARRPEPAIRHETRDESGRKPEVGHALIAVRNRMTQIVNEFTTRKNDPAANPTLSAQTRNALGQDDA